MTADNEAATDDGAPTSGGTADDGAPTDDVPADGPRTWPSGTPDGPPPSRPLVIGYGNVTRGDDGLGWHAAMRLADDPRLRHCDVLARHQLTPELARDFADASLVVLVDAEHGWRLPGVVATRPVSPPRRNVQATAWSHHVDPATLLVLAWRMYGRVPPTIVVTVSVASTRPGDTLSPTAQRALPRVVEHVVELVTRAGH